MESLTKYPLPADLDAQQSLLLNKSLGLSQLFDRFEAMALLAVPENSVVVDLENITFGPGRYSIRLDDRTDLFFKLLYYSLLHFIFEKAYDQRNAHAYAALLRYILVHDLPVDGLTPEEVRVFLVKFLHILERAKSKRKVVVEELNSLPQINVLLVQLLKHAAGHQELLFEKNAREIERNLAEAFGVRFDLLSCDLFLYADEFQVEIRHFDASCEFAVTHETAETIKKIRDEFFLGESAYFMVEAEGSGLEAARGRGMKASKVTKKDTIRSIEWVESEDGQGSDESDEDREDDPEMKELTISQQIEISMVKPKEAKQLYRTQDIAGGATERPLLAPKPRILNFEEIIKQQTDTLPSEASETVRSTTCFRGAQTCPSTGGFRAIGKIHKGSISHSEYSGLLTRHSPISKSVQEIKFAQTDPHAARRDRRVPTFILNRAKQHAPPARITHTEAAQSTHTLRRPVPRITFTYHP